MSEVSRPATGWVALVAAAALAVLSVLVASGATRGIDLATTLALQGVASHPLDVAVNAHTVIGQVVVTLTLAAVLALVVRRKFGGWAWLAPLFILGTGALELVLKFALQHPGPPEEFVRAFGNPLGVRLDSPSSFPSGHTARLTFLAVLIAATYPRRWTWTLAGALVAFSVFARVYIGDHWISDVLGGLTLGIGGAALAIRWIRLTRIR